MRLLRLALLSTTIALLVLNDGSQASSLCKILCCCVVNGTGQSAQYPAYNPQPPETAVAPTNQQYSGYYPPPAESAVTPTYQNYPGYYQPPAESAVAPTNQHYSGYYPPPAESAVTPTYQHYPGYYQPPAESAVAPTYQHYQGNYQPPAYDVASQTYYQQYSPQLPQPISGRTDQPVSQPIPGSLATPVAEPVAESSSQQSAETDSSSLESEPEENFEEGPQTSARIMSHPNLRTQVARSAAVSAGYPQPEANSNVQGYKTYPGVGIYKVHKYGSAWYDALSRCASEGATLAVASSQRQANTLKGLFSPGERSPGAVDDTRFWVGIQERGTHGQFYTVFGERLQDSGYMVWSSIASQPNEPGTTDCVTISPDGTYFDDECSSKFAFICEKIRN